MVRKLFFDILDYLLQIITDHISQMLYRQQTVGEQADAGVEVYVSAGG